MNTWILRHREVERLTLSSKATVHRKLRAEMFPLPPKPAERAPANGHSMEEEARTIPREAVGQARTHGPQDFRAAHAASGSAIQAAHDRLTMMNHRMCRKHTFDAEKSAEATGITPSGQRIRTAQVNAT